MILCKPLIDYIKINIWTIYIFSKLLNLCICMHISGVGFSKNSGYTKAIRIHGILLNVKLKLIVYGSFYHDGKIWQFRFWIVQNIYPFSFIELLLGPSYIHKWQPRGQIQSTTVSKRSSNTINNKIIKLSSSNLWIILV